jgi:hypothetical protein
MNSVGSTFSGVQCFSAKIKYSASGSEKQECLLSFRAFSLSGPLPHGRGSDNEKALSSLARWKQRSIWGSPFEQAQAERETLCETSPAAGNKGQWTNDEGQPPT